MSLKDGQPYKLDELGRLTDIVEARELIHELTSHFTGLLNMQVGPLRMPLEIALFLENPAALGTIKSLMAGAHSVTCEEFDRRILMETGQLVPVDPTNTTPQDALALPMKETLPLEMEKLIQDLTRGFE